MFSWKQNQKWYRPQELQHNNASVIQHLFNSIGKKYTPCQGVVWSQYRLPGTFYVPLGFGVVLIGKVCIFLPAQFWKAVHFTLALLWLYWTLSLSYNFSWTTAPISIILQIPIASSLDILHYCSDKKARILGPQFLQPFFLKYKQCFMKT